MKYSALLTLISALFLDYLLPLALPWQLVLQAGLSPLAPDAPADPAVGVCWTVTEPFQLLIYTPGQMPPQNICFVVLSSPSPLLLPCCIMPSLFAARVFWSAQQNASYVFTFLQFLPAN